MSYPSVSRFMASLDGARYVRFDADGLLYVWFGAHGVHAFDEAGQEVDYWTCGSFANDAATVGEVEESIARRIRRVDELLERAEEAGYEHGVAAGSWVVDGRTSPEVARRLLDGVADGDPLVVDLLPSSPLSGEWAGDPSPRDVLESFDLDEDDDLADEVLTAYEAGFSRGVQDEAVKAARALLA